MPMRFLDFHTLIVREGQKTGGGGGGPQRAGVFGIFLSFQSGSSDHKLHFKASESSENITAQKRVSCGYRRTSGSG